MVIRGCIFDLGGTLVDRYSLIPLLSLQKAFSNKGINVQPALIRKGMGLNKVDHINQLFKDPLVQRQWYVNYGKLVKCEEKDDIFKDFSTIQTIDTIKHMNIIPQTFHLIKRLKDMDIKVGVTTCYNKEQMERIKTILEDNKIYIDNYVSSTCLNKPARPYPYMIYENMVQLGIDDPKEIIKIDDTSIGIQEGLNAGCITIGVSRWSINMDINSYEEMNNLEAGLMRSNNYSDNYYELFKKIRHAENILKKSNPHYVIRNIGEIKNIIQNMNTNK